MDRGIIRALFRNQREVAEPTEGMQAFRTMVNGSDSEALELHTWEVLLGLLFAVPGHAPAGEENKLAGLLWQAGASDKKIPCAWCIESFKWFDHVPGKEVVSQFRLVVDAWKPAE